MLITFSVTNFKSYRDKKDFSLVASPSTHNPHNVIEPSSEFGVRLLRSAAIYGANASGKSNLIAAMNALAGLVEVPLKRNSVQGKVQPFALSESLSRKPVVFTVRFQIESGGDSTSNELVPFEYRVAIQDDRVTQERLTSFPQNRPQVWFDRDGGSLVFSRNLKGQKEVLKKITTPERLFLSTALAFEHDQLFPVGKWIASNMRSRSDFWEHGHRNQESAVTQRLLKDREFQRWANAFVRHADLGIEFIAALEVKEVVQEPGGVDVGKDSSTPAEKTPQYRPYFVHTSQDMTRMAFHPDQESLGTRKLFMMLLPLYDVLANGNLAVLDEFSASLHPSMAREIVQAFHNPSLNRKNAQLVFATHDVGLLTGQLFRRDQVWFTEKDKGGVTDLYSLIDFKDVRENEAFDKGYLRGRYGAIPFFGEFDFPEPTHVEEEATGEAGQEEDLLGTGAENDGNENEEEGNSDSG